GGAEDLVPAARAVKAGELAELAGDDRQCFLPALLRQLAAGEETAGRCDAACLPAFALDRLEAAADDELGRAAADVDHQPLVPRLGRLRMGNAQVDQARLLATGHHFHGKAER